MYFSISYNVKAYRETNKLLYQVRSPHGNENSLQLDHKQKAFNPFIDSQDLTSNSHFWLLYIYFASVKRIWGLYQYGILWRINLLILTTYHNLLDNVLDIQSTPFIADTVGTLR